MGIEAVVLWVTIIPWFLERNMTSSIHLANWKIWSSCIVLDLNAWFSIQLWFCDSGAIFVCLQLNGLNGTILCVCVSSECEISLTWSFQFRFHVCIINSLNTIHIGIFHWLSLFYRSFIIFSMFLSKLFEWFVCKSYIHVQVVDEKLNVCDFF